MKRWPRPDFLRRPAPPPMAAWLLAVVSASVLVLEVVDAQALQQQVASQSDRLERAVRANSKQRTTRSRSAPEVAGSVNSSSIKAGTAPVNNDARSSVVATRLTHRLNFPWEKLFPDLENATPQGLQWLGLDQDADRPETRLEGRADDFRAVLNLVDALAANGAWSEVSLAYVKRSGKADVGLSKGVGFQINARYDASSVATAPRGDR